MRWTAVKVFVICHILLHLRLKKQIVYDGKPEYKDVCVNDVIMTGPDLLNFLLHVLMRFCLSKFASITDVTKCFFQIKLPEVQKNLFRLLWFENNDIEQGNIVPFRFCVHPWGIKSSRFTARFAFKKWLKIILQVLAT